MQHPQRHSQQTMEFEQLRKKLDDEGTLSAALAELEGVEGKEAATARKFLQRRLDALAERARRRAELDAQTPEQAVAGIPR